MLRAYSVEEIRRAEASLAATLPEGTLMERAAIGLADQLSFVPPGDTVLMLIGPGNNGGDALFAGVHLLHRGVRVDLCLLDREKVHEKGLKAVLDAGARIVDHPSTQRCVVDGIVGIGARPGLSGKAAEWSEWIDSYRPFTVAVDVPSGVDVDGCTLPLVHVQADLTVTFGSYKNCLFVDPAFRSSRVGGPDLAAFVDIGLGPHLGDPSIEAIEASDGHLLVHILDAMWAFETHKYTRGVVGVAAGSEQYAGAAHLCVAGAQAGVAGMVRFVGSDALCARVVDKAPEVVAGQGRVQAWVVGPGGGQEARAHLEMALADGVPLVVDAEALKFLPEHFEVPTLLTPHAGELAMMLDVSRDAVEADPLYHARHAARRWNADVLLKGPRTIVASQGHPLRVNLTGSPWLATAGAGDVLAGLAGSLLAAGAAPRDAGSLAAFLHGAASVHANRGGPITASDVARALPGVIAQFHNGVLDGVRDWRD